MFLKGLYRAIIILICAMVTVTIKAENKEEIKQEKTTPANTTKTTQTVKDYIYFKELNYWEYIENLAGMDREQMQTAIERKDAGGYIHDRGKIYIMDHNYQGFDIIGQSRPGNIATVQINGHIKHYRCLSIDYNGYNTGKIEGMRTGDGTKVYTMPCALVIYTCADNYDKHNVIITTWEELS